MSSLLAITKLYDMGIRADGERVVGPNASMRPTPGPSAAQRRDGAHSTLVAGLLAVQRSAGNRAVTAIVQRHPPLITPQPQVDPQSLQGQEVTAYVGPGSTDGGTPPRLKARDAPFDYMRLFGLATKRGFYVQGHLLNENLGGPGNQAWNLTAFPKTPTNSDHLHAIESFIKDETLKKKRWIRYTVKVTYSSGDLGKLGHRLRPLVAGPNNVRVRSPQMHPAALTFLGYRGLTPIRGGTFWYASRLVATWDILSRPRTLPVTRAPALASPAEGGSVSFAIPSPLDFVRLDRRTEEYPTLPPGGRAAFGHLPSFKGVHSVTSQVHPGLSPKLYPTGLKPLLNVRLPVLAERRQGGDRAAANGALPAQANRAFRAGYWNYWEGYLDAVLAQANAARFGTSYNRGVSDARRGALPPPLQLLMQQQPPNHILVALNRVNALPPPPPQPQPASGLGGIKRTRPVAPAPVPPAQPQPQPQPQKLGQVNPFPPGGY